MANFYCEKITPGFKTEAIEMGHIMKFYQFILILSFLWIAGCSKRKGPRVIPDSLFFIIKQNNIRLDDNTLNNMKLYYFKSGIKTQVLDFSRASEEGYNLGVQTTRTIGDISADENIKDYYLEFTNGDIDTLYVDYKHVGDNEAFNNSCYCYYPLQSVKYNGRAAFPDPTITQQKVYRFDKY